MLFFDNLQSDNLLGEIWLPVKGYEGLYEVSNLGRVKGVNRIIKRSSTTSKLYNGKILKQDLTRRGYLQVQLNKDSKGVTTFVHRIVANAFIPNPQNKKEVNHKKAITVDNRCTELEWVTKEEHELHSFSLKARGANHGNFGIRLKDRGGKSYTILQYDLFGRFINKFKSGREASRALKIDKSGIIKCCKGVFNKSGGYVWRLINTKTYLSDSNNVQIILKSVL